MIGTAREASAADQVAFRLPEVKYEEHETKTEEMCIRDRPKGAKTIQLLQRFVEDEEERRGYVPVSYTHLACKRGHHAGNDPPLSGDRSH